MRHNAGLKIASLLLVLAFINFNGMTFEWVSFFWFRFCFDNFFAKVQMVLGKCDNNGGDRPTQLLSTCFSQLRV